VFSWLAC